MFCILIGYDVLSDDDDNDEFFVFIWLVYNFLVNEVLFVICVSVFFLLVYFVYEWSIFFIV